MILIINYVYNVFFRKDILMNKINDYSFLDNLNYILINLENDIINAVDLEDKIYFELPKKQIIIYLNYVYNILKLWKHYYKSNSYEIMIDEFSKLDSIISELELCLADYENIFHMDGISYSMFNIGKILTDLNKGVDLNGK